MRLLTLSVVGVVAMGGAAIACPSGLLATDAITYSGLSEDPFTALSRPVTAGGDQTLEACGLGILGTGQFRSAPDYSFNISDMAGRHVVFDVESDCDPALLVQTSDGQWLFNDDTNGLNPAITIEDPAQMSGTVHVWVGTFMGGGCEATLNLTNVPEDGSMPVPLPDSGMGATDMPTPVPLPLPAPTPTPAPAPMPVQQVVCPNPAFTGQPLTFAASQLVQPQSLSGTAMGSETRVYDCPGVDGGGTATQAPQYTMYLSGMQGYELQLEANGSCDTTLLAYGADGQWYYNDDGAGDLQPRLTIPAAAANGQLSVWMGTFGGQSCPATLTAQAISLAPPTPVSCPIPAFTGQPLTFAASQLVQPQSLSGTAMGSETRVYDCPGVDGGGTATQAPQYTMYLSGMQGYELQLEANGSCDTTLLAYGADGQWYYNDDGAGDLQPRLTIPAAAANGQLSVWMGTFGGQSCPATLTAQAISLAPPTPVSCPNPAFTGQPLTFAASQLVQPQSLSGTAMGSETRVYDCPGVDGGGTATQAPQYTMYLSGMQGYELQLEANGSCDTTLLAYGADGQWYYNDDGAGDLQPRLTIPAAAANGQLSVWMGTFGGQSCPATLTAQAISLAPPTPVSCPNPAIPGPPLNFTAAQLLQPQAYSIQATGSDTRVADCPGVDGGGSATAMPQTSLYLSGMQGYELQLEANGSCDTTLLVHGADGQWYYDDDGAGNLQPSLTVPGAALNGRVDVWVGTFGGGSCPATFTLQASQLAPPPPPQGCPNPAFSGQPITASGDNLRPDFGYTLQTTAAGSTALGECTTPGRGYANAAPNFSLYLSDMQRYGALEIEVNSSCDTTLLVRDAFGQWHFDDDSAGSLMPLLRLTNTAALNGRVDVWVGTYGGGSCAASLALRSQF